jgi:HAD superfamily hydrolase (TIGR01509 family)
LADLARFEKFKELTRARVIVFDFDGVLVDSERFHFETYSAVFKKYGHIIDETEYYKYWTSLGLGPKGEVERYNLPIDPQQIRDEKRPIFSEYCRNGTIRFFPEARELVDLLVAAKKTLVIASGTVRSDIEAVLKNEGLTDVFAAIVGSDLIPAPKPAPDIFLHALDMVGGKPSDALVFEDAEKGVGSANAAGIPVIVIRTRETTGIDFPGADLVLDSHAELAEFTRTVFPR